MIILTETGGLVGNDFASRSFQLDEDQEPLIENSDEECGAESEALAALQNSYVDETEKLALKVASFNFWEALACINLQVKTKQSDRLVGMIKSRIKIHTNIIRFPHFQL